MRALTKLPVILLFTLVLASAIAPTFASAGGAMFPASPMVPRIDAALLDETLRASGISDASRRATYRRAFESLAGDLALRLGSPRSRYRLAKKLHLLLHDVSLKRYVETADGLDSVLDRGEFNCLSASLLYSHMARVFGLDARIVAIPRHVYVRLSIDQRLVNVETTTREGFDLRPKAPLPSELSPETGYGTDASVALPVVQAPPTPESVELEKAVGFLWHNEGRRALERGDALTAARCFLEESRRNPLEVSRSEALAMLLARAFRMAYEAGRFEDAYQIALIGMEVFPGQTTSRDRLLASALKRVEEDCESGRVAQAEETLKQATAASRNPVDTRRLERGACPLIAAASVRRGDWDRAARMVKEFLAAEPDTTESTRLARWVARRQQEALLALEEKSCTALTPTNRWPDDSASSWMADSGRWPQGEVCETSEPPTEDPTALILSPPQH